MTAHDQMRAMLDQLMGTARNGLDETLTIKFDNTTVCKAFLMGCCPHEVLASTRMDMGECSKFHNLALRADYEAAAKNKDYFYDLEAMDQLKSFVADADRKTEQARKRLADTQEEYSGDVAEKAEKVHELAEKIGQALAKAEQLGEEGQVDESMRLMSEIDTLRKEKLAAEADYRGSIPAAAYQQQKLRVCEVCCAYLGINDNDRRLADHFGGKLHLGFIKIRDTLKEFEAKAEERRRERREAMARARELELEREKDYRRDRDAGRDRDRRGRDRRDRDRDRRSRSHEKRRDEERHSRSKRSRSRSKEYNSRSYDSKKSDSRSPYSRSRKLSDDRD